MTSPASTVPERRLVVPVDGGELVGSEWRPEASGPVVLALHGITANHRSFLGLAERLALRMVAPDQRGRGRSRGLPGPYDLDRLADDAAQLLRALDVRSAIVVGHSMGAFVAARLAARHPGLVASLVLVPHSWPLGSRPGIRDSSRPSCSSTAACRSHRSATPLRCSDPRSSGSR